MLCLPAPPAPIALLCAVNPIPLALLPAVDVNAARYFYTRYRADGSRGLTFRGTKAELEMRRAQDQRECWRVSEIIPDLPLADNLKYRYSWRGGQETHELRKEYGEAKAA